MKIGDILNNLNLSKEEKKELVIAFVKGMIEAKRVEIKKWDMIDDNLEKRLLTQIETVQKEFCIEYEAPPEPPVMKKGKRKIPTIKIKWEGRNE